MKVAPQQSPVYPWILCCMKAKRVKETITGAMAAAHVMSGNSNRGSAPAAMFIIQAMGDMRE